MSNAITTLEGEELEGSNEHVQTLAAPNGSLYGRAGAGRVMKFNPVKSTTHIGPDLGGDGSWSKGAMTDSSGIIHRPPYNRSHGILNIDTHTNELTELDANLLPKQGDDMLWESCAAALDGWIYFIPSS